MKNLLILITIMFVGGCGADKQTLENKNTAAKIEDMEVEIKRLEEENQNLKAKIEEMEIEDDVFTKRLENENAGMRVEMQEQRIEMQKQRIEMQIQQDAFENMFGLLTKQVNQDIQRLKQENIKLKTTNSRMAKEIEDYKAKVKALEEALKEPK